MSTDKAVALAEKHGAQVFFTEMPNGFRELTMTEAQLTAMLADHKQQVCDELVAKAGVMPKSWTDLAEVCDAEEVHEAIAAMQAQIDRTQQELQILKGAWPTKAEALDWWDKLGQSEARVAELEKAHNKLGNLKSFLAGWKLSDSCKRNEMELQVDKWISGLQAIDTAMNKDQQ